MEGSKGYLAVYGGFCFCSLEESWRPLQKGALAQKGAFRPLDVVSEKYHKTPAQTAINWLISQENVVTTAKSSSLDHVRENVGALGWQMEEKDREYLRREFPEQHPVSDTIRLL